MGQPSTVEEVVSEMVKNTGRGTPGRSWEVMTPSRYAHACELLQAGVHPNLVTEAIDRIHASAWLKMPVAKVSAADLPRAAAIAAAAGASS